MTTQHKIREAAAEYTSWTSYDVNDKPIPRDTAGFETGANYALTTLMGDELEAFGEWIHKHWESGANGTWRSGTIRHSTQQLVQAYLNKKV